MKISKNERNHQAKIQQVKPWGFRLRSLQRFRAWIRTAGTGIEPGTIKVGTLYLTTMLSRPCMLVQAHTFYKVSTLFFFSERSKRFPGKHRTPDTGIEPGTTSVGTVCSTTMLSHPCVVVQQRTSYYISNDCHSGKLRNAH